MDFDKMNLCDFKNLTIKHKQPKNIFPNLDLMRFKRKKSDKENLRTFKNLYFVKRQKYFKEKIFYKTSLIDVFNELNNINCEPTRFIFYDNCCFVQFTKRGYF